MELSVSSPRSVGLPSSSCISDHGKEVSDDDDDDRNHKHRRQDTRSQSLERDSSEQVFSRPCRKQKKNFENGYPFTENESQSCKNLPGKFDKRRLSMPLDRANQTFSGDFTQGRGRPSDSGPWTQRDSGFSSVDISSRIVQQGSIPPTLFTGRGLPNVSAAQNASWGVFGLVPGIPNCGLDALHSIGFHGKVRPPMNSLNMGIPLQRCRDFEERGFCLRGDMCPMEHGINRIVVEDVQSLSQFNLPVSLPSAQLLRTPGRLGSLAAHATSSSTLTSNKGLHGRTSKSGLADDNDTYTGSVSSSGADVYDPDQPLLSNNGPETSNTLLALQSAKINQAESLSIDDPSDQILPKVRDGTTTSGSQSASLSVWGRIGNSKNKTKENTGISGGFQGNSSRGKKAAANDTDPKAMDPPPKTHGERTMRKPSQKALRTLFVSGIPRNSNKREALLSHFQKFGEIIDIYIPANSERAFVQFSKREEAEAALKAPDAVMGNRFIKLWWANRDSIPGNTVNNSDEIPLPPESVTAASVPSFAKNENLESVTTKHTIGHSVEATGPAFDHITPLNSSKAAPLQKKLESLEQLKEELRKKQEMLEQKRNDFRRQLDKLEKQTTGGTGDPLTEQPAKRPKLGTSADVDKGLTPKSADPCPNGTSLRAEPMKDEIDVSENGIHSSKSNRSVLLQESSTSKKPKPIRPLVPVGSPFPLNRYKLDNRSTGFRIIPPIPAGFANVDVLKEHFSVYGEISAVELENQEDESGPEGTNNCSACVSFLTRQSAERAFINGKCWHGHTLKFVWLPPSVSGDGHGPSDRGMKPAEKPASSDSKEESGEEEPESLPGKIEVGEDFQPAIL